MKIEIRASMSIEEFKRLVGNVNGLCVFAAETVGEHTSAIKTGARHSYAKYLLFPVTMRRRFKASDYDFNRLSCGCLEHRDSLYIIYGVPRNNAGAPLE